MQTYSIFANELLFEKDPPHPHVAQGSIRWPPPDFGRIPLIFTPFVSQSRKQALQTGIYTLFIHLSYLLTCHFFKHIFYISAFFPIDYLFLHPSFNPLVTYEK